MVETLITAALTTWSEILDSEIVLWWFAVTTIITTLYAMKTNHLSLGRLLRYAGLFALIIIGIEGPKMHYIATVLGRSLNNPTIWTGAVFNFTFFTCTLAGIGIALILNKLLNFFFDDPWLSLAQIMYRTGDRYLKRSDAFRILGVTTLSEVEKLANARKVMDAGGDREAMLNPVKEGQA